MHLRKLAGLAMIVLVLLTACGKKGPSYTQYIPKNASYVIALDVKEMIGKLEKDSLTVENMMEVLKDTSDPSKYASAMSIWGQFKDAGLDFEQRVFIAVPSINMEERALDFQVLAGLKDAKKLEDFISKMPEAPAVKKDGDISYAAKNDMIIGWKNDAVMILASPTASDYNYGGGDDSQVAPQIPGESEQLAKLKKYFTLKKSESIAEAEDFADLMGKKADIAVYTNSSTLAGGANMGLAMMPKVKELLQDIHSTSTINFEEGKVVMDGNTYVSKKLGDIINKYTGPVVDMDLIEPYPSNNVAGIAAFAFKTEMIGELLKEAGFDALADMALGQKGLTTADLIKAFKGDIAIVVSDFGLENVERVNFESGEKFMSLQPTVKMMAAVRIGDRPTFDKLINLLIKEGMLVKSGNRLLLSQNGVPELDEKMIVGVENGLLLISSDETVYSGYVAKSTKIGLDDDVKSHIKGASFAVFADAGKILNAVPDTVFGSNDVHARNILARAKPMFKTLYLTTENFDGKKIHGTGEMNMADGKNSLPQLVRFLMYAAEEMKLHQAANKAKWEQLEMATDSTDANE